jgi:hypothetical protein
MVAQATHPQTLFQQLALLVQVAAAAEVAVMAPHILETVPLAEAVLLLFDTH